MHVIYSLLFNCRQLVATHLKNVYLLDRLTNEDNDVIINRYSPIIPMDHSGW